MLVIPAIDIRQGKVVRLYRGMSSQQITYVDSPVEVSRKWEREGAELLHVVDLDGAFEGVPRNLQIVRDIVGSVAIPIELGGGLRSLPSIEAAMAAGVWRVVLGSAVVDNPDLVARALEVFPDRVGAAVDCRKGDVVWDGWSRGSGFGALELARRLRAAGVGVIEYTDVLKDGTMSGPNLRAAREMALEVGVDVIVAGGISTLQHVKDVAELAGDGVVGMIVGRALYEGRISLPEALAYCERRPLTGHSRREV